MASLNEFFDLFLLISDVYQLSHPRGMNLFHDQSFDQQKGNERVARALTTNASSSTLLIMRTGGMGDTRSSLELVFVSENSILMTSDALMARLANFTFKLITLDKLRRTQANPFFSLRSNDHLIAISNTFFYFVELPSFSAVKKEK